MLFLGKKLYLKNKATNPFYMIDYTLAGDNFGNVIEALEKHNAVLMSDKSAYQMMKSTGNPCRQMFNKCFN